jgi:post-segregation antitoxin (ccd killing protein)
MGPVELPVHRYPLLNPVPSEELSTEDLLEAFAPRVRELLEGFRDRRQLSAIARDLGFNVSRLTEMITRDENGDYRRKVTPYYLIKFIEGNIMSVEEILEGRPLETLQEQVRIFFERMVLSRRTIRLVYEAQKRGIDVDRLLETILEAR